jgi:hypothetical protein
VIERLCERSLSEPVAGVDVDHRRRGTAYDGLGIYGDPTRTVSVKVIEKVRHPDGSIADQFCLDGGGRQYLCSSRLGSGSQQCVFAELGEFFAVNSDHQGTILSV